MLSALWRNASNDVPETEQAVQGKISAPGNLVPQTVLHKLPEAHNEKVLFARSWGGESYAVGHPRTDVLITNKLTPECA